MKIGIPNTLFSNYHFPYWHAYLTRLGADIVISDDSGKETANRGGRYIPHEFCIPIKVFIGHVLNLLEKNVDMILVPRMISKEMPNFFCPKLHGLVELVRFSLNLPEERLFVPEVVSDGLKLKITEYSFLKMKTSQKMKAAESFAEHHYSSVLRQCREHRLTLPEAMENRLDEPKGPLELGVIGYAYCLYDPFISKGLVKQLRNLGATIHTWEMLDPRMIQECLKKLTRPVFWNFGRIMLGAGFHFLNNPRIDGVIYVTTFGCGPDSVTMKLVSLEAGRLQKPFLCLNLDEHDEDGHLRTRLEAFIDMLVELKEEGIV